MRRPLQCRPPTPDKPGPNNSNLATSELEVRLILAVIDIHTPRPLSLGLAIALWSTHSRHVRAGWWPPISGRDPAHPHAIHTRPRVHTCTYTQLQVLAQVRIWVQGPTPPGPRARPRPVGWNSGPGPTRCRPGRISAGGRSESRGWIDIGSGTARARALLRSALRA